MTEEREKLLLRLLVSGRDYTREEMETMAGDMDIDRERIEYLLMLGLLGERKGFLYIPDKVRPRITGIYRSYRVRNLLFQPFLEAKLKVLVRAGIPVMLLKGAAMRAYYAPGVVREMSDIDLAVPEERFKEALSVLEASGMKVQDGPAPHAWTLMEGGRHIDLHRWIFKTGGDKAAGDFWEKAVPVEAGGVQVLVPAPEDMFIHVLDNRARDLILNYQVNRTMKWLYDGAMIMNTAGTPDWKHIAGRAEELLALSSLKMVLPDFAEIFPEFISGEQCREFFPRDESYLRWKRKAESFVEELKDFNTIADKWPAGSLGLPKLMRVIRHYRTQYRCFFRDDLKKAGIRMSFPDFFLFYFQAESFGELIRRYLGKKKA